ncbi:MAG: hypothetical protein H5T64_10880 [Chloroflexi bacterium]|nr:hypothetical protein [Chloroflexota bacterium]
MVKKAKAKKKDPLEGLRRDVARRQGGRKSAEVSNRNLVEYLAGNIDWSRLLPFIIPLLIQILRNKQASQAPQQSTIRPTPSYPGMGAPSGTGAPAQDFTSLFTTILGALLQPSAQAGQPGGLFQAPAGGPAAQPGSLLDFLGALSQSQRSTYTGQLLDSMASSADLDRDGIPDALEQVLGGSIESDRQREGAVALLESLLQNAKPEDLSSFSRAVQALLPPVR